MYTHLLHSSSHSHLSVPHSSPSSTSLQCSITEPFGAVSVPCHLLLRRHSSPLPTHSNLEILLIFGPLRGKGKKSTHHWTILQTYCWREGRTGGMCRCRYTWNHFTPYPDTRPSVPNLSSSCGVLRQFFISELFGAIYVPCHLLRLILQDCFECYK